MIDLDGHVEGLTFLKFSSRIGEPLFDHLRFGSILVHLLWHLLVISIKKDLRLNTLLLAEFLIINQVLLLVQI